MLNIRFLCCALLLCAGSVQAQSSGESSSTVYKCTDSHGNVTYANMPCDGHREVIPEWKLKGQTMPALTPEQMSNANAGGAKPSSSGSSGSSSGSDGNASVNSKIDEVTKKLGESWNKIFGDDKSN